MIVVGIKKYASRYLECSSRRVSKVLMVVGSYQDEVQVLDILEIPEVYIPDSPN